MPDVPPMDMIKIQHLLRSEFIYESDTGRIDDWTVTKGGGIVRDDCDGYALTLLYRLCGGSMIKFWWMQITFQAVIWHVKSYNGNNHAVLWYRGWWSDNMEPEWYRTEDMRHTRKWPWIWPFVALKLLITKVFG